MLKSAVLFSFLRKYRNKLLWLLTAIVAIVLVNLIYTDVVEYLTINEMREYVLYALLTKWLIILLCVVSTVYITMRSPKPISIHKKQSVNASEKNTKNYTNTAPAGEKEKEILKKDKLKSQGDKIIEELVERKRRGE